ncbi:alanyl-tRNA editing protein [Reinekea blandensis]|uniref:Alanine--tRNA ligase n=1 Tax=Reinekea blandensis MED297 TaxID=314283 RepID=A4BHI9_9GAMM|nr:alanyl-tRNA editing protein [Reinekea blandensis]EAR08387.1 predicted metal-dependent Hydrolase [Reinekea blandensis MED297]
MTHKQFAEEAYQTTYQGKLIRLQSDPPAVILDSTIFYALSGGQPGDTGELSADGLTVRVVDTRYDADRKTILHYLDPESPVPEWKTGQIIEMKIDWARRHRLMRMHTAMHLLCSLIPYPVTGGGVGERESRVEFDMDTADFDKADLSQKLNQLVTQNLSVDVSSITDDMLDNNPELIRTMSVQPPRGQGSVRMINIGQGIDYQPCGGTHVRETGEIGELVVTKIKSKGKQNKRVSLALVTP